MSQAIPLSRITTPRSASPYVAAPDSPGQAEIQNVFGYEEPDEALNISRPWQRNLYMLVEQPTSSQPAFLVHLFTTFLIVLSAVVTVLETVPAFHSISGSFWFGLETTLVVLFTIEYTARCIAHATSWMRFFKWVTCECTSCLEPRTELTLPSRVAFFGIIDLLGILPYYIEIALQQDTVSSLAYPRCRLL